MFGARPSDVLKNRLKAALRTYLPMPPNSASNAMIAGDTIAAVSSSVGAAARMIVRLSGPASRNIVEAMAGGALPGPGAGRVSLRFRGRAVPAWLYVFAGPRSYTGEDLVELHVPGNPLLVRLLLQELIRAGARQADAGEFTARAYFNGRIDLTGAEGVAATIAAHGEDELHAARRLLAGELSRRLAGPIDALTQVLALVEVGIDFSEEDVRLLSAAETRGRIGAVADALRTLVAESSRFERLSHEVEIVLVGRPNAGKSTLLNALCGEERAVVSPVAGTTRDVLSAEVTLPRGLVRITDVAGLGDVAVGDIAPIPPSGVLATPSDHIAVMMRQQSIKAVERADRLVLVRDITDSCPLLELSKSPDLVVQTKVDLAASVGQLPPVATDRINVSAVTGQGMAELRAHLDALAFGHTTGSALALNARHLSGIDEALAALERAAGLAGGEQAETLAFELRCALDALGRIVGQVSPDDVLARVFSAFCIGK